MMPTRMSASFLAADRWRGLGFLAADQPVAVAIQRAKLLRGAEELAHRNVSIGVAVHFAKPDRPPQPRLRPQRAHRPDIRIDPRQVALAHDDLVLARNLVAVDRPGLGVDPRFESGERAGQLAAAEAMIMVSVEQVEQRAAAID